MKLDPNEQAIVTACSELQLVAPLSLFSRANVKTEDSPLLGIGNRFCRATLSLHGAQVLGFKPHHREELLWLSPNAVWQSDTPIRGGIPVCLPWFGVNQANSSKPKHGFARTCRWQLERATTDQDDNTLIQLGLRQFADLPHALFSSAFTAELQFTFGQTLGIDLTVRNCSTSDMPLSWALHSYHPVGDLEQLRIVGLEETEYLDNTRELQRCRQPGEALIVRGELDRAYLNVGATQSIIGTPGVHVSGVNAPTAIVWNPGAEVAAAIPDLGENTHRQFICLERGAAFDNAATLAPQTTLRAGVVIGASDTPR